MCSLNAISPCLCTAVAIVHRPTFYCTLVSLPETKCLEKSAIESCRNVLFGMTI